MLSKKDTNTLKGFALILLLIHHLFWKQNGLYDDIRLTDSFYLVNQIGILSKVCVTIFVFLSGYGLMAKAMTTDGIGDVKQFYLHRFKKLMINYWFIWFIFVPISYFVFDITFTKAYPDQTSYHLLADILGLHNLLFPGTLCYNPTWWFYSCIIVLYVLFPLFHYLMKRDALIVLILSIAMSFLPIPIPSIKFYVIAFVIGMWMAKQRNSPHLFRLTWISIVLLFFLCIERKYNAYPLMMDIAITVSIVWTYQMITIPSTIKQVLGFIGKHSMNIFLFHTFIFSLWFKEFIYATRNPITIFTLLLGICLIISIALDYIKKYTIYRFV